jgi:hypothetical protein
MQNRRVETRMLCADLVDVKWKDRTGKLRRTIANLEDISLSGACVQMDQPVPLQTTLQIAYPKGELQGRVCYCIYREIGYFLGIEFDPGYRWSQKMFRPAHLLDPRRLVNRAAQRAIRQVSETVQ